MAAAMGNNPHISIQPKRGVRIILCDPATKRIEAETRHGEVIAINAYSFTSTFRWPKVGESWMVKEENGSWYLDSIWEGHGEPAEYPDFECPGNQYASGVIVKYEGKLFRRK